MNENLEMFGGAQQRRLTRCPHCGSEILSMLGAMACTGCDLRLADRPKTTPRFYGDDYVPERDEPRLTKQQERIFAVISDGGWWSVHEVNDALEVRFGKREPEQSISRQIRYLREMFKTERRYEGDGLYRWRVSPNAKVEDDGQGQGQRSELR